MLKQWDRHGVGLFSVLRKEDERLVGRVGYLLWDSERWVNAMSRGARRASRARDRLGRRARVLGSGLRDRGGHCVPRPCLRPPRQGPGHLADRPGERGVDSRRREDRRALRAGRRYRSLGRSCRRLRAREDGLTERSTLGASLRWMKRLVALAALCLVASVGGAEGSPATLRPTLSFTVDAGVSSHGFIPLGGGICLGNRRVTEPRLDGGIAWSPNGSQVAFYRQGRLTADVLVADADGSRLRNLTPGGTEFSWAPDWSPDGSRIVYVESDEGGARLVTIRPDGSDSRIVPGTSAGTNDLLRSPKWTPGRNLDRLHADRRNPRHPLRRLGRSFAPCGCGRPRLVARRPAGCSLRAIAISRSPTRTEPTSRS